MVGSPITGTATVHVDPGPLARIDVTPAEVSLQIGNQQQFLATGRDAQGNPVPITPTWTTTGGTINPTTGLYTATTVGDFTVTATDPGTGIQGTATVHVTQAGPPARLILRPLAARTRPGGIVQFTATATDARGRPTPVTVAWSASGGTITDDGLFTAGPRRGLVTVMARVPGTRLRAIALVMILWR